MHLALLNVTPAWLIILGLLFVFSSIALSVFFLSRKYFTNLLTESMSPAFGVMGTSYGFLLGFCIAILWQNYTTTSAVTDSESYSFNLIINDLQYFPNDTQEKIVEALHNYIKILKTKEWPALQWGKTAPESWHAINNIYAVIGTIEPKGKIQNLAYDDIFRQIESIVNNRLTRLHAVSSILPVGVRLLIILGAIFIIYSIAVNDTKKRVNELIALMLVCFLLSFNIGLVLILAYPFAGETGITGYSLNTVIPYRLAKLEKKLMDAKKSLPSEHKIEKPLH